MDWISPGGVKYRAAYGANNDYEPKSEVDKYEYQLKYKFRKFKKGNAILPSFHFLVGNYVILLHIGITI